MLERQIENWLHDYNSIIAFVQGLQSEIDDKATDSMGVVYDKDQLSKTYKFSSVVENAVISNEKLYEMLEGNKNLLEKLNRALESLNNTERKIVMYRCVEGKYYYMFTNEVHFSERTCRRIKREAIIKMRKAIFGV